MNVTVLIIELIVLAALFVLAIAPQISKDPEAFVTDYPPEIQVKYYETHAERKDELTKGALVRKLVFLVVAALVLSWMASLAGAETYLSGTLVVLLYVVWVGAFDTFVLDWVFFPRIKRWRLPGTEHMDREYRQKWFHLKEVLKVAPLGIVYALLCGLIVAFVF